MPRIRHGVPTSRLSRLWCKKKVKEEDRRGDSNRIGLTCGNKRQTLQSRGGHLLLSELKSNYENYAKIRHLFLIL